MHRHRTNLSVVFNKYHFQLKQWLQVFTFTPTKKMPPTITPFPFPPLLQFYSIPPPGRWHCWDIPPTSPPDRCGELLLWCPRVDPKPSSAARRPTTPVGRMGRAFGLGDWHAEAVVWSIWATVSDGTSMSPWKGSNKVVYMETPICKWTCRGAGAIEPLNPL